ncbi:rRNA methyltransferase 3, mitochondrial [Halictus rubicundus]|uniref:rRNA methyltransferase 3, mitochondrial n=1 Tax=Halictus rubicundus TaxID=77578 RepID=UPI004037107E
MVFLNVVYSAFRPLGRNSTKLESIKRTIDVTLNLTLTRTRTGWVTRRPVAIINEDELFDIEDTTKDIPIARRKTSRAKSTRKKSSEQSEETSAVKKDKRFTVFEHNDPTITSLLTKVKSRKRREKNDKIILEGHRLIKDALEAGAQLDTILFNNYDEIVKFNHPIPDNVKLYKIPYKTIQLWSSLTSPPGVMGIFTTPDIENNATVDDSLPLTIICDNVREPGNLGSIMRAAAAVGCEKLILIKGCVDLWEPKVLRTASGAHFRLPVYAFPSWDEVPSLISESSNIFIADSNFGDEFVSKYDTDTLQPSIGIFDVDPEQLKSNQSIESESKTPANKKAMADLLLKLPIVPYYAMDYTKQNIVLVLSGETEGLTFDSYELLNERKAIRINIPLVNGVDSLNTGVALGIVTFEMRRQFIKKQNEL